MSEMETKKFLYNVALYGNANWKGHLTATELLNVVTDYYEELINNPHGTIMMSLLENLREDALNGSEDAMGFMEQLTVLINGK